MSIMFLSLSRFLAVNFLNAGSTIFHYSLFLLYGLRATYTEHHVRTRGCEGTMQINKAFLLDLPRCPPPSLPPFYCTRLRLRSRALEIAVLFIVVFVVFFFLFFFRSSNGTLFLFFARASSYSRSRYSTISLSYVFPSTSFVVPHTSYLIPHTACRTRCTTTVVTARRFPLPSPLRRATVHYLS